jgi:hypothetical protein
VESTSESQYKKNLPNAVADRHETHNMLYNSWTERLRRGPRGEVGE